MSKKVHLHLLRLIVKVSLSLVLLEACIVQVSVSGHRRCKDISLILTSYSTHRLSDFAAELHSHIQ